FEFGFTSFSVKSGTWSAARNSMQPAQRNRLRNILFMANSLPARLAPVKIETDAELREAPSLQLRQTAKKPRREAEGPAVWSAFRVSAYSRMRQWERPSHRVSTLSRCVSPPILFCDNAVLAQVHLSLFAPLSLV